MAKGNRYRKFFKYFLNLILAAIILRLIIDVLTIGRTIERGYFICSGISHILMFLSFASFILALIKIKKTKLVIIFFALTLLLFTTGGFLSSFPPCWLE
jgi:hypothetical protein